MISFVIDSVIRLCKRLVFEVTWHMQIVKSAVVTASGLAARWLSDTTLDLMTGDTPYYWYRNGDGLVFMMMTPVPLRDLSIMLSSIDNPYLGKPRMLEKVLQVSNYEHTRREDGLANGQEAGLCIEAQCCPA